MKLSNILKCYGDRVVLNIKDIDFPEGKIIALIGPNGSGKSTLGKIISSVISSDSKIEKSNDLKVGYMPQKSFAFDMSVLNNLTVNSKDKEKAIEYAKKLKLDSLLKQNAKKLSGGELSKVALIRALLNKDDVIVLDEPTAAMDIESLLDSETIIKNFNKETNTTIVLISHSFSQVKRISDYVYFLDNGEIIDSGTPEQIENSNNELIKKFISLYSK